MFRKVLMAAAGAVALTGSAALAAPPQPVPLFSWTGLYLGGQIGYAWADDAANATSFVPGTPGTPGTPAVLVPNCDFPPGSPQCILTPAVPATPGTPGTSALFLSAPSGTKPQGVIGGAHVGYNLQINQWVIGLEGTVDGTSVSKTVFIPFGITSTNREQVQGSIRARAGVAFDRVLLYATGGAAFTGIKNTYSFGLAGPLFLNESISKTRAGWTVGGGLEYAVTNNWSVRAEYRYSDFGSTTDYPFAALFAPMGGLLSVRHHLTQNQVQVGFSYKFDTLAPY